MILVSETAMDLVNRYALVVRPAQPMIDWVRKVDLDMEREPVPEAAIRAASNVYLIPDFDPPSAAENYLKKRAKQIFEAEVGAWFSDPELWPKQRGWKTFGKWFEWEIHEMLWDLEAGPLVKESGGEPGSGEFNFYADLFDAYDELDEAHAAAWGAALLEQFEDSPEAQNFQKNHPNERLKWTQLYLTYLHFYETASLHDVAAEALEYALMHHFPQKVIGPPTNARAVIDEFRAFYGFLAREFAFKPAAECLRFLKPARVVNDFDAAMNDPLNGRPVSDFFSPGAAAGMGSGGFPGLPFKASGPDVGRNDPCPIGRRVGQQGPTL